MTSDDDRLLRGQQVQQYECPAFGLIADDATSGSSWVTPYNA
jgi:hypothetical protein